MHRAMEEDSLMIRHDDDYYYEKYIFCAIIRHRVKTIFTKFTVIPTDIFLSPSVFEGHRPVTGHNYFTA